MNIGGLSISAANIAMDRFDSGVAASVTTNNVTNVTFNQTNKSPNPLSEVEIYRQSKNLMSQLKREVGF